MSRSMVTLPKGFSTTRQETLFIFYPRMLLTVPHTEQGIDHAKSYEESVALSWDLASLDRT